ncbi:peptidoglycan editing factor PgeF [Kerstersia gyiorum]|uniref:peptidoglycan editing factor PgeF n=1 Tax=Kerstersia gyiorum TaxID=206506 RepID=UPI0039EAC230
MGRVDRAGLPVVTAPDWLGAAAFTTTRQGGSSVAPFDSLNLGAAAGDDAQAVARNRNRLAAALPGAPVWLRQVHGIHVHDADADTQPGTAEPEADAAVTTHARRVLAILTADCLPVVIAEAHGKALGAAHAGWRGLAGGVLEATLAALRQKCPDPVGWRAWIGPAIGPAAFEVGEEVRQAFVSVDAVAADAFQPRPGMPGKWLANLPALAERRLRLAGVEVVAQSGECTFSDTQAFFSYRRDGMTGRQATLAWLP